MSLLSLAEAAKRLGVSRPTVYGAIERRQIKTVTLGGRQFIPEAEIVRILSPLKDGGKNPSAGGVQDAKA